MALYRHIILSLAVALTAFPPTAVAQRLAVQAGRWNLDYGEIRCSLSRRLGGPQSPILILSSYLGRDEPEIILTQDGAEDLPDLPRRVEVVLLPGNQIAQGVPESRRVQGGRIVSIRELGEGFIDRVAQAQSIQFRSRGQTLINLNLPGATAAVAALRECNDDLLRSWGVDTAVPVARRPRLVRGSINHNDYPPEAITRGAQGAVVARFMVETDGRVQNCSIAVSSSHASLDLRTCALIVKRLRFEPAMDEQGRPVRGHFIQTVRWMLPDG